MLGGKFRAINIFNRKKKWMKSISKMNITGKARLNGEKKTKDTNCYLEIEDGTSLHIP